MIVSVQQPALPTLLSTGQWLLKDGQRVYSHHNNQPMIQFPRIGKKGFEVAVKAPRSFVQ
ncbi:hypothetical protein DXG01_005610, partial [Tephrocybe rancida]